MKSTIQLLGYPHDYGNPHIGIIFYQVIAVSTPFQASLVSPASQHPCGNATPLCSGKRFRCFFFDSGEKTNKKLVGGLEPWNFTNCPIVGMMIQSDVTSSYFFRGVGQPPIWKWWFKQQEIGVQSSEMVILVDLPTRNADSNRNSDLSIEPVELFWWGVDPKYELNILDGLPSGKLTFCYGKSPFLMGKSTINGHFQ